MCKKKPCICYCLGTPKKKVLDAEKLDTTEFQKMPSEHQKKIAQTIRLTAEWPELGVSPKESTLIACIIWSVKRNPEGVCRRGSGGGGLGGTNPYFSPFRNA